MPAHLLAAHSTATPKQAKEPSNTNQKNYNCDTICRSATIHLQTQMNDNELRQGNCKIKN